MLGEWLFIDGYPWYPLLNPWFPALFVHPQVVAWQPRWRQVVRPLQKFNACASRLAASVSLGLQERQQGRKNEKFFGCKNGWDDSVHILNGTWYDLISFKSIYGGVLLWLLRCSMLGWFYSYCRTVSIACWETGENAGMILFIVWMLLNIDYLILLMAMLWWMSCPVIDDIYLLLLR